MLPEQVEIVVDLHLRPYYGNEDETNRLYYNEAKDGTTGSTRTRHCTPAFATSATRWRCRRLTDGDTASSVLAEFLGLVDSFDFEVKALYVDSEFYDGKCLTLMQAHNYAYVVPVIAWGNDIQQELSEGWSREIDYDLTTEFDGHEWTVGFPVMIDCSYKMGRYDDHGVVRHG